MTRHPYVLIAKAAGPQVIAGGLCFYNLLSDSEPKKSSVKVPPQKRDHFVRVDKVTSSALDETCAFLTRLKVVLPDLNDSLLAIDRL